MALDPIDIHVGSRVRLRRNLKGMSQEKLGLAIGLTFQQIQKYERGANRIGSSRLFQLAQVLDVPPSFFFDDMPAEVAATAPSPVAVSHEQAEDQASDDEETRSLVETYYRIKSPLVRKRVFELVKAFDTEVLAGRKAPRRRRRKAA
ncbi:transcriptional repressor DicA [Oceanibacterium hippocampi]|uniref:Transcriptional repressor DicA n=1 Tax=Oceanibacterium hippocampi TaxID=745714 RepID=A0A1Y5TUC9_9PROT|nr:helix-turn-helix transcriptional regulator [Oceanibacterium hippocampi]SLN73018.1 transcriptional repressor DicA [Oceanibacterium hippocampi]